MMDIYRTRTVLSRDRCIVLKEAPFKEGEVVEVVVRRPPKRPPRSKYPLLGKPIRLDNPFEGVAVDDWEVLK